MGTMCCCDERGRIINKSEMEHNQTKGFDGAKKELPDIQDQSVTNETYETSGVR